MRQVRLWLVPAVLIVIAALQLWRAHTQDLSPWIGAGFGMFATIDGERSRLLILEDRGTGARLQLPEALVTDARRALQAPSAERLQRLETELSDHYGTEVEVEVWRAKFNHDTNHLNWERLRSSSEPDDG